MTSSGRRAAPASLADPDGRDLAGLRLTGPLAEVQDAVDALGEVYERTEREHRQHDALGGRASTLRGE
ncbi:hypothetical protein [Pseudonocardia dioxanivorans]|uniref:hypothetical protein n=1 Tax=Pseudonocardia dioxanivorans TaxID=240495 RepID=UPI00059F8F96|nr:hypothetical protein [Pseudonocardia dioxanivorans]